MFGTTGANSAPLTPIQNLLTMLSNREKICLNCWSKSRGVRMKDEKLLPILEGERDQFHIALKKME